MKTKSLTLMCVAVGCGLVAMLGVKQYMNKNKSKAAETVEVLVATQSIDKGVPLDETNTEFKAYPKESLVPGVIVERKQVENRGLKSQVYPGNFILEQQLGAEGVFGDIIDIPSGMRIVSLKVDATTSHSGMMLPGHRVDVMCTYKRRTPQGMVSETKTVLQFIKVFATDNISDASASDIQQNSSKNISLLVSPEEATKFLQAKDMSNNNLHLALRNSKDTEDTDSSDLNDDWLFPEDEQVPVDPPEQEIALQLQNEMDAAYAQEDTVEVAIVEETPMWDIEIFSGEERRVEQVPLPVTEEDEAAEQEAEQTEDTGLQAEVNDPPTAEMQNDGQAVQPASPKQGGWKSMIESYFSGA